MEKDPQCNWCRKKLKMYEDYPSKKYKKMPDDFPTIDHLKSRLSGKRVDVKMKERTLVLSCPTCNHEVRNKADSKKHRLKVMYKSGAFPKPFRWLGKIIKFFRRLQK